MLRSHSFGVGLIRLGLRRRQQHDTGNMISVTVSPATATVTSGGTTQFTATVTGDSSNGGVTWSVSSSSATPGTIDATGKYTAPSVTAATTATVIATSKTDTTKTGSATVTINPAAAAAVTISPQTAFVGGGTGSTIHSYRDRRERDHRHLVGERHCRRQRDGRHDRRERELHGAGDHAECDARRSPRRAPPTPRNRANASVSVIANGVVTSTANVQVASYTITAPATANVSIQFGPDTTYGLNTWQQPTASGGGPVTILVAGMKMNTAYHMRANVVSPTARSSTTSITLSPPARFPQRTCRQFTVTTPTAGANPQPGVELLDLLGVGSPSYEWRRHRPPGQRHLDAPTNPACRSLFQSVEVAAEWTFPRGHRRPGRGRQFVDCRIRSGGNRDLDIHRRPAQHGARDRNLRGMPRAQYRRHAPRFCPASQRAHDRDRIGNRPLNLD